jgi:hypothetical protein
VPLRIGNYTAITSDVYKDLELSAARVSQLKREGRFDGAWVKENGVLLWDLEIARECYESGWNQRLKEEKSPTRKKTKDLEIPALMTAGPSQSTSGQSWRGWILRPRRSNWLRLLVWSLRLSVLLVLYGMLWVIFLIVSATNWLRKPIQLLSTNCWQRRSAVRWRL